MRELQNIRFGSEKELVQRLEEVGYDVLGVFQFEINVIDLDSCDGEDFLVQIDRSQGNIWIR